MSKLRRLRVDSLADAIAGQSLALPNEEARHAQVLRLHAGTEVEIFDAAGRRARARLFLAGEALAATLTQAPEIESHRAWLKLAVAWPKGKRAAVLVEKCSELGVDCIQPVRYARSVVSKDDESEGVRRLRRVAAEAAKQSGRGTVPEILAEADFADVLQRETAQSVAVALLPEAVEWLPQVLQRAAPALAQQPLLLFAGPEGGFAPEEVAAFAQAGIQTARVAPNVLRVETAAFAACAVAQAWRGDGV